MNKILLLQKHCPDICFFKVETAECCDEEYKRYTDVCDSYYFKITVESRYESLHFGYTSTDTETIKADIPHKNILIKDGEVAGFLYDTSQTPDGYEGYNGQIVFLINDEGVPKNVGGRATVGCNSSSEKCTLLKR